MGIGIGFEFLSSLKQLQVYISDTATVVTGIGHIFRLYSFAAIAVVRSI
jgi:hypothetical protein